MRKSIFAFIAIGLCQCSSESSAHQAEIVRFPARADGLETEKRQPLQQVILQRMENVVRSFVAEADLSVSQRVASGGGCEDYGYRPTYWLRAETERRRAVYFPFVVAIACEFGLPARLLDAVIAQESGYNPKARSAAGAMGMMQIMPGTARSLGLAYPLDPIANMRAGARYLRVQKNRFGRMDLALAAYNAGPERRSLNSGYVPAIPETLNYVRTITTNWARLTSAKTTNPAALDRASPANLGLQATGYREVNVSVYQGRSASNEHIE